MQLFFANRNRTFFPYGNFGDELNAWLWPRLLPGVFDEGARLAPHATLVGMGTLLNHRLPKFRRTIVFGTGFGLGDPPRIDGSWHIYCVRGPLTARALGLDGALAITDPAVLVPELLPSGTVEKKHEVSFVPYFMEYARQRALYDRVSARLGWNCIDPCGSVDTALAELRSSRLVVTAAMHGAIVADALRVPWIPVRTNAGIPPFKWRDWWQSLEIERPVFARVVRLARITERWHPWGRVEEAVLAASLRLVSELVRPRLSPERVLARRKAELKERLERLEDDLHAGVFDDGHCRSRSTSP